MRLPDWIRVRSQKFRRHVFVDRNDDAGVIQLILIGEGNTAAQQGNAHRLEYRPEATR